MNTSKENQKKSSKYSQHESLSSRGSSNSKGIQDSSRPKNASWKMGKGKVSENAGGPCFINGIPIELFTSILSRLDPDALKTSTQVCRHWRRVIDDTCWKSAFLQYFGRAPFRRISNDNWKIEFIKRVKILRAWEKGRGRSLSWNPGVGIVNEIYVEFSESWILAGSLQRGIIARCDPTTGKTSKDIISSTHPNINLVSAMKIESRRILWGYDSGMVGLTTMKKQAGHRVFKRFADFHQGPVTDLAWSNVTNIVVSGGEDGIVKLWDVASGQCVLSLSTAISTDTPSKIICVVWDPKKRLIAATQIGTIHLWSLDSANLGSSEDFQILAHHIPHSLLPGLDRILSIHYNEAANSIVVAYEESPIMKKFDLETLNCVASFEEGHIANVTHVTMDDQRNEEDIGIRLLASGDASGRICLWNINESQNKEECIVIKPLKVIDNHLSSITAIYIDAIKLIVGSMDGTVKVWDVLAHQLIRVLNTKINGRSINPNQFSVKCIYSNDYQGVISMGGHIKTWDYSGKIEKSKKKLTPSVTTPKSLARLEIKNDVQESTHLIALEKRQREEYDKRMKQFTPMPGLSDDENLQYALMVSREDHQRQDEQLMEAIVRSLEIDCGNDASEIR